MTSAKFIFPQGPSSSGFQARRPTRIIVHRGGRASSAGRGGGEGVDNLFAGTYFKHPFLPYLPFVRIYSQDM